MLATTVLTLALAATGFSQALPEGYRRVYITSAVDTKFIVVPKTAAKGGDIVVQTNTNKPEQAWYLKSDDSKIQLANTTLCIDAGAKSEHCIKLRGAKADAS